jgi:hypothetical protein
LLVWRPPAAVLPVRWIKPDSTKPAKAICTPRRLMPDSCTKVSMLGQAQPVPWFQWFARSSRTCFCGPVPGCAMAQEIAEKLIVHRPSPAAAAR